MATEMPAAIRPYSMAVSVIAEGIEDRDTADLLARMGCKQGQGYFFGRPMPAAEFEEKFLFARDGQPEFVNAEASHLKYEASLGEAVDI